MADHITLNFLYSVIQFSMALFQKEKEEISWLAEKLPAWVRK